MSMMIDPRQFTATMHVEQAGPATALLTWSQGRDVSSGPVALPPSPHSMAPCPHLHTTGTCEVLGMMRSGRNACLPRDLQ